MSKYHLTRCFILRLYGGYILFVRSRYHYIQYCSLFKNVKRRLFYGTSSRLPRSSEEFQTWSQAFEPSSNSAPWRVQDVVNSIVLQGNLFGYPTLINQKKRKYAKRF